MSKLYNLSEEQLDFISFMKARVASHAELKERLESCLASIVDNVKEVSGKSVSGITLYHSPHTMIKFLSMFSQDEHFKWYTHKWDQDGQSFDGWKDQQKQKTQDLSVMLYNTQYPVNERTYYQVWNFINFSPSPKKQFTWRDNSGQANLIGWHSIVDLHKQDTETPIENILLPNGHQFKDYIRLFKASIEFRTDLEMEDRFNLVVKKTLKKNINGAVNVSYSDNFRKIGRDLNIYCDVPAVIESLGIISEWIVRHKVNGTNVKVDLVPLEDSYELIILHEHSYFSNIEKLSAPSGDLDKLRNRLFSVCDLTISGDYLHNGEPENSVTVYVLENLTTKNDNVFCPCRIEHIDRNVGGVEYILKFYK